MIIKEISTIQELIEYESFESSGNYFRGQTQSYYNENGEISIPTSFNRHGCYPPLMLKWSHYAKAVVRAFSDLEESDITLELTQSILQHYGWRSFYIDLTKSLSVACWFANNCYHEKNSIWMCENFEENPVLMKHKEARYERSDSDGHVYLISRELLANQNVQITDLTLFDCEPGTKTRFQSQMACLAGNLSGGLPPSTISHHLIIKPAVLELYCASKGLNNTVDLFPSANEDFWLNAFLNLPWEIINSDHIPAYARSLPLPEYHFEHVKHLPPSTALYETFWISDAIHDLDGDYFDNIPFFRIPGESYYCHDFESSELLNVMNILSRNRRIAVELSTLITVPENSNKFSYEKGVVIEMISDNLIYLGGIEVSHPGHQVAGVGVLLGWYYQKGTNGQWGKINHPDQCPCDNSFRHKLQFSLLNILNHYLAQGEMKIYKDNIYVHTSITELCE